MFPIYRGVEPKEALSFKQEDKDLDLMKELMNCLNHIDYSIFDEDYINELLDSRDNAPFDTEGLVKLLRNFKIKESHLENFKILPFGGTLNVKD